MNNLQIDTAKICEIAFIAGSLKCDGIIKFNDNYTLEEMYDKVYEPIYLEWVNGIGKNIFSSQDEQGYIGAYAERRLTEQYKINISKE